MNSNTESNVPLDKIVADMAAETNLSSRSFSLIKDDLERSFAYVQPNASNLSTYGARYFEIIFRSCVEFEILSRKAFETIFNKSSKNKNIAELSAIQPYLHVDGLRVLYQDWDGGYLEIDPLSGWQNEPHELRWFRSYNELKHDRHQHFAQASLENAICATAALFLLLNHLKAQSYNTFFHSHHESGVEFVFYDSPFSILAPVSWSPPACLDSTPSAP